MSNLISGIKSSALAMILSLWVVVVLPAHAMVEGPSPLYIKIMQRWASVTNFAENASQVAVDKFKYDLRKDPQIAPFVTDALLLDLKQFFYELFNSQETMIALANAYSEYYTIDEMQSLIEFYETPEGKKLTNTRAELTNRTQVIGDQLLKSKEKDYIEIIAKHIKKNVRSTTPVELE